MYNRYIPQADGSFQRSRVAEPELSIEKEEKPVIPATAADQPKSIPITGGKQMLSAQGRQRPTTSNMQKQYNPAVLSEHQSGSVSGFLKGLLPQNFDTEDLIVVLLLLLMSGNSSNDQNAALLTLGIYLFM